MKNSKKISLLLALLFVSGVIFAEEKFKPYKFKTAIVEYTYSGNAEGTQTLYISEHGWNSLEVSNYTTKVFGNKSETNDSKLILGLDIYTWKAGETSGIKIYNSVLEQIMEDPEYDNDNFLEETFIRLGFQNKGKETFDGKECDVWKGIGSTVWLWNDVAVKTEVKVLGQKTIWTATSIQFDVPVDASHFKVPGNIEFQDMGGNHPMDIMLQNAPAEGGSEEGGSEEGQPQIKSFKDLKNLMKIGGGN